MKYGIREICDVVLKAKADMTVGGVDFKKNAPVLYFDSLKTSTMEGAATTVYAQGGRGNARLVAWEGERTVTFTMEDALISELGLSILTGAGVIETKNGKTVNVHTTLKISKEQAVAGYLIDETIVPSTTASAYALVMDEYDNVLLTKEVSLSNSILSIDEQAIVDIKDKAKAVLFDFYVEKSAGVKQMEITADSFCGNFYLEASTLFRTPDGKDHPAEFVIPNCKIQSNFTFNMAATGDPSTFTFTIDAFPDYTRFDYTKKVYSIIQIIDEEQPIGDVPSTEEMKVYGPDGVELENGAVVTINRAEARTTGSGYILDNFPIALSKAGTVHLVPQSGTYQANWNFENETQTRYFTYTEIMPPMGIQCRATKFYLGTFNHSAQETWTYNVTVDSDFAFTLVYVHEED